MYKFKIGDIVELKIPSGYNLIPGSVHTTGFSGGLTPNMISILRKYKSFKVVDVNLIGSQMRLDNGESYHWDARWFTKVQDSSTKYDNDRELINVDISIEGDKTTVQILDGIGQAIKCGEDKYDVKIGILIAMARALGFDKSKVDQIIDVIYDDNKKMEDCSNEELLKELLKRATERAMKSLV